MRDRTQRTDAEVACALALATLFSVACQKTATPAPAIQSVAAATVDQIRPATPERYSATIYPVAQVDLAFKSAGLIEKIYQVKGADGRVRDVQAGDFVPEGTELAVVRKLDYEQRVQQAQQQTSVSEAQLAQAEVGMRQAQLDYDRAEKLYQSASLIKPDYDQAKTRLESAKAQVEGSKAGLETARNAVSQANLSLTDTTLRAPFSGWVTARNIEKGSLVGNVTVGFSLVDTSVVKALFAVPDTSLKSIRLGQQLSVELDALNHPVRGAVTSISPQADPKTHVFSVEVSIANANGEVRPGMVGGLTLGAGSRGARLVVPLSAVVRSPSDPNGFAVFQLVNRSGKTYAVAQTIMPGTTFGNSIEVLNGVTAGERIVGLGGDLLRDGQEVKVLP
jgi:RND family efflux transporter MFP subunit